jgi:hypothetical protein
MPSNPSIAFTDTIGAAVLTNGRQWPFSRFRNWAPDSVGVGDRDTILGTGDPVEFRFRTDYVASLEVDRLDPTALELFDRLKNHLLGGGSCTVTTGDNADRVYVCKLRAGTEPSQVGFDKQTMRYTVKLELRNTAAAFMTCDYA